MKVLVLGASGKTGSNVVQQLLSKNIQTRILIREHTKLNDEIMNHPLLEVVTDSISEMNQDKIDHLIKDCDVVISCLGHNISFKGMFGKPRNLVYKAVKDICEGIKRSDKEQTKFILMSTTAYTHKKIGEKNTLGEKIVLSLLKLLLPPHQDNMKAANYFVNHIGNDTPKIKWVLVRPDSLIDINEVSSYVLETSPNRSPVFNSGKTSRINVADVMVNLITDEQLWNIWEFKAPVIYNI